MWVCHEARGLAEEYARKQDGKLEESKRYVTGYDRFSAIDCMFILSLFASPVTQVMIYNAGTLRTCTLECVLARPPKFGGISLPHGLDPGPTHIQNPVPHGQHTPHQASCPPAISRHINPHQNHSAALLTGDDAYDVRGWRRGHRIGGEKGPTMRGGTCQRCGQSDESVCAS